MKLKDTIKEADLVVFDLDGSIVDSLDLFLTVFQKAMLKFDKKCTLDEVKNNLGPCSFSEIRKQLIPKSYKVLKRLMRDMPDAKLKVAHGYFQKQVLRRIDEIEAFEDAPGAIRFLSKQKKLVLLTNSDKKYTSRLIKKLKLGSCFKFYVYGDSGFKDKASALKFIIRKFGSKKAVYVGDAPLDVKAAKKARCTSVAIVRWYPVEQLKKEKPDYIVKSLAELC